MQISRAAFSLVFFAMLAGCGKPAGAGDPIDPLGQARAGDDNRIDCAIAGAAWAKACGIERLQAASGLMLIVRHPDGGFRRLLVTKDGRGVVPADGAESAVVRVIDSDRIEVAVAGDAYRLPATIKR